jgi:Na+/H+-dicarboxylate symporter
MCASSAAALPLSSEKIWKIGTSEEINSFVWVEFVQSEARTEVLYSMLTLFS